MRRAIRKQTQDDFIARIERLDPAFAKVRPCDRYDIKPWEQAKPKGYKGENPFIMAAVGVACVFASLAGLNNPDAFRDLLLETGWPPQFLKYAMNGAGILVVVMLVLLIGNVFRIFNPRATGRWNASGLVVGSLAGFFAFTMPPEQVDAAFAYFGFDDAHDVVAFAQARTLQLASVDWASVVMVSSAAK